MRVAAINIPGVPVALEGSALLTGDTTWRATGELEIWLSRVELGDGLATLTHRRQFDPGSIRDMKFDQAGHALMARYTQTPPPAQPGPAVTAPARALELVVIDTSDLTIAGSLGVNPELSLKELVRLRIADLNDCRR